MFDITELDEMLCQKLNYFDLARCARVSKKWHRVITPFFWKNLSGLEFASEKQQRAFRRLVLQDYLLAQQQQPNLTEEQQCIDQPSQPLLSRSSILATYGPRIQTLPPPDILQQCLASDDGPSPSQQPLDGLGVDPTVFDLMRHLYKRCPNFRDQHLSLNDVDLEADEYLKTVAEYVFPRTSRLTVNSHFDNWRIPSWKLKYVLSLCSSTLKELTLNIIIAHNEGERISKPTYQEPEYMPLLKRLNLVRCKDKSRTETFWSWLWKRCDQVERLELNRMEDIAQSLANGMLDYMPSLSQIAVRGDYLDDTTVAVLLSGARNGWKEIWMREFGGNTPETHKVLMKHSPTLERLELYNCTGFTSKRKVQLLANSPKLHTYIDQDDWDYRKNYFGASSFIDQDSHTGSLRPWACEASLKVFKGRITGIPRPDLEGDGLIEEAYPGEGRAIQRHVYDRLARLTHLETLWLAREHGYGSWNRSNGLEMSLVSGLDRIEGLKSLRDLNVLNIETKIGVDEIQWMANQWPRLRVIQGRWRVGQEIEEWLQKHHPRIYLKRPIQ